MYQHCRHECLMQNHNHGHRYILLNCTMAPFTFYRAIYKYFNV